MNELEFRNWLKKKGFNNKLQSDFISRLKKLEKELNYCDIDEEYCADRCSRLLSIFVNKGENVEMQKYPNADLPVGKYHLSTYKYALKQYIEFIENQ